MLLANYASDSGSDSESETPAPASAPAPGAGAALAPKSKLTTSSAKAGPSASATTPTLTKGKKRPVRITLDLPTQSQFSKGDDETDRDGGVRENEDVDEMERERESKKIKMPKGKGSSALLSMLPPPKRKLPSAPISKGASLSVNKTMASSVAKPLLASTAAALGGTAEDDDDVDEDGPGTGSKGGLLLPPSLARNRGQVKASKAKAQEEQLDLFGLSTANPTSSSSTSTALKPSTVSSAPSAPDFVPPAPSASDPYPGYYQTPSGEWKAYDPEYYHSFFPSASASQQKAGGGEEEEDDGRVGKHWNAYEKGQFNGNVLDIDANKGLKDAREEEERKAMMKNSKPKDEYEYKQIGQVKGLAAQRHQLTSLLSNAYSQREELEERIAQNKKSMRAAGTKYGF